MEFLESLQQNGKPSHVQSVGRALLLIELLAHENREMSTLLQYERAAFGRCDY